MDETVRQHDSAIAASAGPGALLLAALGVLFIARLVTLSLSSTDLYMDEAQYWAWAQRLDWGYFTKPPLIAWLIAGTTAVCGDSILCIRLPAIILQLGTALVLFYAARSLYGAAAGIWTAILYATLPGISFASLIISTDGPLLFFWSLALAALFSLRERPGNGAAVLLGIAIGLGVLTKYAMLFFVGCWLIAAFVCPTTRRALFSRQAMIALVLAFLIVLPNLWWNVVNGFETVAHTAEDANWTDFAANWRGVGEYLGAQFGIFGPLLFGALLVAFVRIGIGAFGPRERMLAAFSLPILVAITAQALIYKANANWGATAFPAGLILLCGLVPRTRWRWVLPASLAAHLLAMAVIGVGFANAERLRLPNGKAPFWGMTGWTLMADEVRDELAKGGYRTLLTNERYLFAELAYELRDLAADGLVIRAWKAPGTAPAHQFAETAPLSAADPEPVLFVGRGPLSARDLAHFSAVRDLGERMILPASIAPLPLRFMRLEGFDPG